MTPRADPASAHVERRPRRIAYILVKQPSFSQTFLAREIAELRRHGVEISVHSLIRVRASRAGPPSQLSAVAAPEISGVRYFRWWNAPRLLWALPREIWRDPALLRDGGRIARGYRPGILTDFLKNVWGAIFGVCRAAEFRRQEVQLVHGAWATSSATAAAVLGRLCGIPFSFAAHAYDIYKHGGDAWLDPKLRAAAFVHTSTQANLIHLQQRVPEANIILARNGLEQLPVVAETTRAPGPAHILSVGRLTSIKGHQHQLAACARLKEWGLPFEARVVGEGELERDLRRQITALGLADCVTLCGGLPHEQAVGLYRWADIFWHTGVIDEYGNRDGLPNVIPEAFAHRLPVICGLVPGATEAVTHEQTGLVVDVTDADALAKAVKRLAEDEPLRKRLGANGRRWVEQHFLVSRNVGRLAEAFRQATASPLGTTAPANPVRDTTDSGDRPLISFIIPVHNCLELTQACLASLEQTVTDWPWEAILVDDCSTDGTAGFLAGLGAPYRVIRNESRQNYSASNNRAATIARGEFLCLLNNDTVLTPGWLEPMLRAFRRFPKAGVVGNIHRNPRTGRYDHMGIVFSPRGVYRAFGKHFFFLPLAGYPRWRAVTGACCLLRRSVFQEVGGFDEAFINGCEDLDLCLRLGEAGYQHYVAVDSVIDHYVSSSAGRRDYEQQNKQRFLERWAGQIPRTQTLRDRLLFRVNAILRFLCRPGG